MEPLFYLTILIFIIGAVGSLLTQSKGKFASLFGSLPAVVGSISGIILSLNLLLTNTTLNFNIPTTIPLFNFSILIDPLAAFFILIISIVSLASSIYGYAYMQKFNNQYNLGYFGFFYNLFLASLMLVTTASNGLYFLFVWELMSITSYFLVIFENKVSQNIRAGIVYLVMTHFGTIFIFLMFMMFYLSTGSFDFNVIRQQSANIPEILKSLIFLSAFIGFGTKAGIIPLHIWLPKAHPAAPSQVSALMSGVMIKIAILMFIRLFLDLIPSQALWWGIMVLIAGAVSSLLGVLYALAEHDIKKLLAFHSVENIGIILMGVGSAMIFYSLNLIPLAIMSTAAALYHTLNHAVFKSLLFFGAGSVVYQTHSHNIEEYGGLIKKMPYTAFFFLIGAIAISAIPPLNGFASEWLTYQSLFSGLMIQGFFIKTVFVLAIASLAFTGGLAAACFVKAFALTFLAKPRSIKASNAKESPIAMNLGMSLMAILCLVLGVFSSHVIMAIGSISQNLSIFQNYGKPFIQNASRIEVNQAFASLNLQALAIALFVVFGVVFVLVFLKTRKQKEEVVDTWDCGAPPLTTRAEITATAFSRSLITMFGGILKPTKENIIEYLDVNTPYFTSSKTVNLEVPNVYEQYIYRPLQKAITLISSKVGLIQSGNINKYLFYMFITLISLLIWASF